MTLTIADEDARTVLVAALSRFDAEVHNRQTSAVYFLRDPNPVWERQRTIAQTLLGQLEEGERA